MSAHSLRLMTWAVDAMYPPLYADVMEGTRGGLRAHVGMSAPVAEAVWSDIEDAHDGGERGPGPHAAPLDGDHLLQGIPPASTCAQPSHMCA